MSGGGGVGPSSEQEEQLQKTTKSKIQQIPQPRTRSSVRRFFSFRQLNMLTIAVFLSATGMVSLEDFGFVVFSFIYMYFLSKFSFPILSSSLEEPPVFGQNNKVLGLYVSMAAIIGLFIPIAYIFQGIFEGDKEGIKAAAPHVFLLASQVFMEGVVFSGRFSLPVRVFVPVFYNSRRIFSIVEWLRAEISKVDDDEQGYSGSRRWRLYIGRGLAIVNMGLWSFNLFGFLLPVYLPKAFKKYYSAYKVNKS